MLLLAVWHAGDCHLARLQQLVAIRGSRWHARTWREASGGLPTHHAAPTRSSSVPAEPEAAGAGAGGDMMGGY